MNESGTATRMRLAKCLQWLAPSLAALVLLQLGARLGLNAKASPPFVAGHPLRGLGQATIALSTSADRQRVQQACHRIIVPLNPNCPRQLIVKYLPSAGFGHQFTELLFGMYAAQYLGLTFTWNAIRTSDDHGDNYTSLVERLGLERFFVTGLGMTRADDLKRLRASQAALFGQWVEAGNLDKRKFAPTLPCNNSVLTIEGWWHCHGTAERNCFWAAEHAFLFQRFGVCLRAGVQTFGTAFERCVFIEEAEEKGPNSRYLPRDTLVVVWHLRFGDVAPRKPEDAFFANVVQVLKQVVPRGLIKRVRIVLVGGGKGTNGVAQAYVDSLRGLVSTDESDFPRFQIKRFGNSSFEEQFLAMMQADVLIGSGSSVPQVAALLSGKPMFFNHVAKHGYGYGQEAMADAVDMDGEGRVLDSLRRIQLALFEKINKGSEPCRQSSALM